MKGKQDGPYNISINFKNFVNNSKRSYVKKFKRSIEEAMSYKEIRESIIKAYNNNIPGKEAADILGVSLPTFKRIFAKIKKDAPGLGDSWPGKQQFANSAIAFFSVPNQQNKSLLIEKDLPEVILRRETIETLKEIFNISSSADLPVLNANYRQLQSS